ncbi:hypothetical protein RSOLAG22IIIB_00957 [Rhizoctonia solani]|uniref:RING-type domain-containing protein n=1 Tax=Rhizoctonia solani TaxID=456999 RepID=A0A0K6G202_9AGAM|nr:hypothetical protein RSOLAG22IIIB_00957 [Rhizoctonia solani]
MSDDEYFGDDDLFTSEELDSIPALNQPPSPVVAASNLPNPPAQPPPQAVSTSAPESNAGNPIVVQSTNDAARTPGSERPSTERPRRTSSRFSTIMNALRTGPTQQPGKPFIVGPLKSTDVAARQAGSGSVFGPQTGLLLPSNRKNRTVSLQSGTSQSSIAGPSRLSSQSSPTAGLKRRRTLSPAREALAEAEVRTDTWSVVEQELTCAICCDVFISPQITHCGHSACAPCLRRFVQKLWLSKNNNCPICRAYINPNTVLSANRLASSMIDRMMTEATKHKLPDWCTGGKREIDWKKRKRIWEGELARDAAAARSRANTRSTAAARHRIYVRPPLFLDDEDYDDYDYDDLEYDDEYDYNLY